MRSPNLYRTLFCLVGLASALSFSASALAQDPGAPKPTETEPAKTQADKAPESPKAEEAPAANAGEKPAPPAPQAANVACKDKALEYPFLASLFPRLNTETQNTVLESLKCDDAPGYGVPLAYGAAVQAYNKSLSGDKERFFYLSPTEQLSVKAPFEDPWIDALNGINVNTHIFKAKKAVWAKKAPAGKVADFGLSSAERALKYADEKRKKDPVAFQAIASSRVLTRLLNEHSAARTSDLSRGEPPLVFSESDIELLESVRNNPDLQTTLRLLYETAGIAPQTSLLQAAPKIAVANTEKKPEEANTKPAPGVPEDKKAGTKPGDKKPDDKKADAKPEDKKADAAKTKDPKKEQTEPTAAPMTDTELYVKIALAGVVFLFPWILLGILLFLKRKNKTASYMSLANRSLALSTLMVVLESLLLIMVTVVGWTSHVLTWNGALVMISPLYIFLVLVAMMGRLDKEEALASRRVIKTWGKWGGIAVGVMALANVGVFFFLYPFFQFTLPPTFGVIGIIAIIFMLKLWRTGNVQEAVEKEDKSKQDEGEPPAEMPTEDAPAPSPSQPSVPSQPSPEAEEPQAAPVSAPSAPEPSSTIPDDFDLNDPGEPGEDYDAEALAAALEALDGGGDTGPAPDAPDDRAELYALLYGSDDDKK